MTRNKLPRVCCHKGCISHYQKIGKKMFYHKIKIQSLYYWNHIFYKMFFKWTTMDRLIFDARFFFFLAAISHSTISHNLANTTFTPKKGYYYLHISKYIFPTCIVSFWKKKPGKALPAIIPFPLALNAVMSIRKNETREQTVSYVHRH